MTTLLDDLRRRGVQVVLAGDRLRLRGPREAITDEVRALVREHKQALLDALRPRPDERREQILAEGRRRGFPALPLYSGVTLASGEDTWRRFTSCGGPDHEPLLDRALVVLGEGR